MTDIDHYKKYIKYANKNFLLQSSVNMIELNTTENGHLRVLARLLKQLLIEYYYLMQLFPDHINIFEQLSVDQIIDVMTQYNSHDINFKINVDQLVSLVTFLNVRLEYVGFASMYINDISNCDDFNTDIFKTYLPAICDSRNYSIAALLDVLLNRQSQSENNLTLFFIIDLGIVVGHIFTIDRIENGHKNVEFISIQSGLQVMVNNNCNENVSKGMSEKLFKYILSVKTDCTQFYAYAWKNLSQILIKKFNFVHICDTPDGLYQLKFFLDGKIHTLVFDEIKTYEIFLNHMAIPNISKMTTVSDNIDYRFTFKIANEPTLNIHMINAFKEFKTINVDIFLDDTF